jgi:hypothetical protein
LQLQLLHSVSSLKIKTSERDARVDLLRKAAGLPGLERPKVTIKPGEKPVDSPLNYVRSTWTIPQLSSFLYPANRDRSVWRRPHCGDEITFNREEMASNNPNSVTCCQIGSPTDGAHCRFTLTRRAKAEIRSLLEDCA